MKADFLVFGIDVLFQALKGEVSLGGFVGCAVISAETRPKSVSSAKLQAPANTPKRQAQELRRIR